MSQSLVEQQIRKDLRYNVSVNMSDAMFFGAPLGFGSFGTIIPLFVSELTTSATLIGLVPAIHAVGWQLPQLFTANKVSRTHLWCAAASAAFGFPVVSSTIGCMPACLPSRCRRPVPLFLPAPGPSR